MEAVRSAVILFAVVFLLCLSTVGDSRAQMFQCPPGTTQVGGGGGIMCQCPDGSYYGLHSGCRGSSQPAQASRIPHEQTAHVGHFGAIAYSPSDGALGWSYDNSSWGAADATAMRGCGQHSSDCRVVVRFNAACGAVAGNGNGGWGADSGADSETAQHNARVACQNHGNYDCQVLRWVCSSSWNGVEKIDCGNNTCTAGNVCSRGGGCIPEDKFDCGQGRWCEQGFKCSRDMKRCIAHDAVDCGSYSCGGGMKCASGNQCIASNAVDCGGGRSCPAGYLCVRGGAECSTREEIAERAAEERRRKEEEAALRKRQAEEHREAERRRLEEQREAARLKEEERQRAIERKRQEEAEAKQRKEQEKRLAAEAEAARKAAEVEAKRQAEEAKRAEEARLKSLKAEQERQRAAEAEMKRAAEAEAKQKAAEARRAAAEAEAARKADETFERRLLATMNNPQESPAARAIAAIALGKDPSSTALNLGRSNGPTPHLLGTKEREFAQLALNKVQPASPSSPGTFEDQLRRTMNDPNENPAARQIAAIALGADPRTLRSSTTAAPSLKPVVTTTQPANTSSAVPGAYTFSKTGSGAIQVSQNGKIVATVTPARAVEQYGYAVESSTSAESAVQVATISEATSQVANQNTRLSLSAAPTSPPSQSSNLRDNLPASPTTQSSSSTVAAAQLIDRNSISSSQGGSGQALGTAAKQGASAASVLDQFYQSTAGSTLLDSLAAAGGAVKGLPRWASALGYLSEGADYASALRQRDKVSAALGVAQVFVDNRTVQIAGMAGGPVAAAAAQGAIDIGKATVSPWLATVMFNANPAFFTPASPTQPIRVDPFTQKPIPPALQRSQTPPPSWPVELPPPGELGKAVGCTFIGCVGVLPH